MRGYRPIWTRHLLIGKDDVRRPLISSRPTNANENEGTKPPANDEKLHLDE
jgi:hypothetical protein